VSPGRIVRPVQWVYTPAVMSRTGLGRTAATALLYAFAGIKLPRA